MSLPLPDKPTLADLQRAVAALEAHHGWDAHDLVTTCFLMGEEVGELFSAVRALAATGDDDPRREARTAALAEEAVDVLNYVLALATRAGVDLEAAFRAKNTRNWDRTWS